MSKGAVLGALAGGVVLGMLIKPDPIPHTEFVDKPSLPEVVTHKEVETKEVPASLPEACLLMAEDTTQLVDLMNEWDTHAKDFYDELDSVDNETLNDQTANNDLVIRVNKILASEGDVLYQIFFAQDSVKNNQKLCEDAIESTD